MLAYQEKMIAEAYLVERDKLKGTSEFDLPQSRDRKFLQLMLLAVFP